MKGTDDLFQLIHSLNKHEKRFFKLSASIEAGKKEYLNLFDLLSKQKTYNEEYVRKKLKMNKAVFAFQKNYLYRLILNRMALFASNKTTSIRIYLEQADFLYGKGLYNQYKKVLSKTKEIATQSGKQIWLLDILKKEYNLAWKAHDLKGMERLLEQENNTVSLLKNENDYNQLTCKINMQLAKTGFFRKSEKMLEIKKTVNKLLILNENHALTFHSKRMLYSTLRSYSTFAGNFKKGYFYAKKLIDLYHVNPEKTKYASISYLSSLFNFLSICIVMRKYDEIKYYLNKLSQDAPMFIKEREKAWMFFTFNYSNLTYHIMIGQFAESVPIVEKLEDELRIYGNKLDEGSLLSTALYYNSAIIYFGAGRFEKCIKLLNKIRNEIVFKTRPDIEGHVKIFYLIAHFEKGNYDLLPYLIKSVYRYLLTKKRLYEFENIFLDFLGKRIVKIKSKKDIIREFTLLKHKLDPLQKTYHEKWAMGDFDYNSWLESKIENRSFAEIVRQKAIPSSGEKKEHSAFTKL